MNVGVNATPLALFDTRQMIEPVTTSADLATVTRLLDYKRLPQIVRSSPHLAPAVQLCEVMATLIEDRGWPNYRQRAHNLGWVVDMEALLRIDARQPAHVLRVLRWLDAGTDDVASFWAPNILSPKKLRLRWMTMAEQYKRLRQRQVGGRRQGLAEATGVDVRIQETLAQALRPELSRGR